MPTSFVGEKFGSFKFRDHDRVVRRCLAQPGFQVNERVNGLGGENPGCQDMIHSPAHFPFDRVGCAVIEVAVLTGLRVMLPKNIHESPGNGMRERLTDRRMIADVVFLFGRVMNILGFRGDIQIAVQTRGISGVKWRSNQARKRWNHCNL